MSANLAVPWERLGHAPSPSTPRLALLRGGVLPRRTSCVVVWPQRGRLQGLARARVRTGPRVWELAALHVDDPTGAAAVGLLDLLAQAVGQDGGLRLFLRLPSDSPFLDAASRAGFVVSHGETLLARGAVPPQPCAGSTGTPAPNATVRHRRASDELPLFHLYCGATPARVRALLGMTREEWHDAQEGHGPGLQEWVLERQGKVRGWVRARRGRVWAAQGLAHPEAGGEAPLLLDVALAHYGGPWRWLVPDYQTALASALRGRGFQEAERYYLLVREVAVPVPITAVAPAVEA